MSAHWWVLPSTVVLAAALTGCPQVLTETQPDGGGPSEDAGVPVDLVFDNSDGGSLDGFPVLIALDSTRIDYASVGNPATELRFYDPDTRQDLPFQIDRWSPAGESLVWVRVPNIAAGSTTDRITLYSGKDAKGTEDATGASVWGSSSAAVWHLGPGALTNSASALYAATSQGTSRDNGQIGSCLGLSSAGTQRVEFADSQGLFDGWTAFSLELWVRADYAQVTSTTGGAILDKGGALNLGRVFASLGTSPTLLFQVDLHFTGTGNDSYLNTDLPLGVWTYFAYTFDGRNLNLYKDGVVVNSTAFPSQLALRPSTGLFRLGESSGSLVGAVDEVRISQVAHSAAWIRAQHRSMRRQFVTFQPR